MCSTHSHDSLLFAPVALRRIFRGRCCHRGGLLRDFSCRDVVEQGHGDSSNPGSGRGLCEGINSFNDPGVERDFDQTALFVALCWCPYFEWRAGDCERLTIGERAAFLAATVCALRVYKLVRCWEWAAFPKFRSHEVSIAWPFSEFSALVRGGPLVLTPFALSFFRAALPALRLRPGMDAPLADEERAR